MMPAPNNPLSPRGRLDPGTELIQLKDKIWQRTRDPSDLTLDECRKHLQTVTKFINGMAERDFEHMFLVYNLMPPELGESESGQAEVPSNVMSQSDTAPVRSITETLSIHQHKGARGLKVFQPQYKFESLAAYCRQTHPAYDISQESSSPPLASLRIADKTQGVLRKHMVACYEVLERAEIEHHQRRRLVQEMLQKTAGSAANPDEYFNVNAM